MSTAAGRTGSPCRPVADVPRRKLALGVAVLADATTAADRAAAAFGALDLLRDGDWQADYCRRR